MKKLTLIAGLLVSQLSFANAILLDNKVIELGNLSDTETNMVIDKAISFTRNAETPKKVTIKYALNSLKKECIEYAVKVTELPAIKKTVCETSNGGSFLCEEKEFSGLYEAKTECVSEGLARYTSEQSLELNFSKAVKLAPGATETVGVSLLQKDMMSDKVESVGRMEESHSLYKVKKSPFGNKISFKAL